MSDAKHTPGPWFAEKSSADFWYITVSERPFSPAIAQTWPYAGNHEGNARLIAAAPELLERLREACEEIESLRRFANNNGGMFEDEQFSEGLSAIAKAEGRE